MAIYAELSWNLQLSGFSTRRWNSFVVKMSIWSISIVFLYCHCSVLVNAQLQTSFKGTSGQRQKDNYKHLSHSTSQYDYDKSNQTSSQQSLALIAEDENRRLDITQVNYSYFIIAGLSDVPYFVCFNHFIYIFILGRNFPSKRNRNHFTLLSACCGDACLNAL